MIQPKISIIMPVYNGANYLREAIDSALAQTHPSVEILVINDGSNDNGETDDIARSYGGQIKYIVKSQGGVASALNAGIAAMTGDVFCWLSHDDLYLPHKIEKQVEEWERRGGVNCVLFSDYRLIGPSKLPISDVRMDHAMLEEKPIYSLLRVAIHGCSIFIPKNLFDVVGNFNENLIHTQDYDLWFRMLRRFPCYHMPEILILSRCHDEQNSKRLDKEPEVTNLWCRMMDAVPAAERASLEGSSFRFYRALGDFLRANKLHLAAKHADTRADEELDATLVSVVIPTHGRPEMAASAVRSALSQAHPQVEVIVVDDGSEAADAEVLASLLEGLSRVRLIRQPNLGVAAARNRGWVEAYGDYVAFLDSDDLFRPGKIAVQLRAMEEAGASFCHTSYWRKFRGEARLVRVASGARLNGREAYPAIVANCEVATTTVMLRRHLYKAGLSFPEDIHVGEDVLLWINVASRESLLGLDEPLSIVRASKSSCAFDIEKQLLGLRNIIEGVRRSPHLVGTERELVMLEEAMVALSTPVEI